MTSTAAAARWPVPRQPVAVTADGDHCRCSGRRSRTVATRVSPDTLPPDCSLYLLPKLNDLHFPRFRFARTASEPPPIESAFAYRCLHWARNEPTGNSLSRTKILSRAMMTGLDSLMLRGSISAALMVRINTIDLPYLSKCWKASLFHSHLVPPKGPRRI